jgi:hypothetical protein
MDPGLRRDDGRSAIAVRTKKEMHLRPGASTGTRTGARALATLLFRPYGWCAMSFSEGTS